MFQYAYAKMYQKVWTDPDGVTVDISSYSTDHLREFALGHFCIDQTWVYSPKAQEIKKNFSIRIFICRVLNRLLPGAEKLDGNYEECTFTYRLKYFLMDLMGVHRHNYSRYRMPAKALTRNKLIEGMWHDHAFFDSFIDELREQFTLKDNLSPANQAIILNSN